MRTAAERKAEAARARQITEETVQERKDWELGVYKRDLRYKDFERVVKVYTYTNLTAEEMHQEVRTLRRELYRETDGWRLTFNPLMLSYTLDRKERTK